MQYNKTMAYFSVCEYCRKSKEVVFHLQNYFMAAIRTKYYSTDLNFISHKLSTYVKIDLEIYKLFTLSYIF